MTTIQAIRFENVSFEAHHTSILKNITGIIELILSLGGSPKQAVHEQLINAIKASMIPTIESQKKSDLFNCQGL